VASEDDLDGLAAELDAAAASLSPDTRSLDLLMARMAHDGASDLLLLVGEPPAFRVNGRVIRSAAEPLDAGDIEDMVLPGLHATAARAYRESGIADAAIKRPGLGRFRVHLHRERGRPAATIRLLPARVPRFETLGLPAGVARLATLPHGLVLIGGATGSGKSTTLAALVNEINRQQARHIVTVEDPIEYEHANQQSVIQQIEIGIDAPDFPTALRGVLRQAPDVIVVGEMRDAETMRMALAAGETGHLVLTTVHATDVSSALARMTDSFPAERQPTIRQEIAAALSAVLVQTLLPASNGGRVPAAELLMVGYGARQHIRRGALHHLHQEATITRKSGSFTLEDTLVHLVKAGVVDRGEAALRANHPDDFANALP
jgi:twitching motility protein PilT